MEGVVVDLVAWVAFDTAVQCSLETKHSGPGAGLDAGIRSAQVAESDFPVSQGKSEFPWV
jgi:hypothetical protein